MKFRKGDLIKVTSGRDKGKTGKIEKIFDKKNTVLIPQINLCKKHKKPQGEGKPGGIIDLTKPLSTAKISLICPKCQQPARIGYQLDNKQKKLRICKKCHKTI